MEKLRELTKKYELWKLHVGIDGLSFYALYAWKDKMSFSGSLRCEDGDFWRKLEERIKYDYEENVLRLYMPQAVVVSDDESSKNS